MLLQFVKIKPSNRDSKEVVRHQYTGVFYDLVPPLSISLCLQISMILIYHHFG